MSILSRLQEKLKKTSARIRVGAGVSKNPPSPPVSSGLPGVSENASVDSAVVPTLKTRIEEAVAGFPVLSSVVDDDLWDTAGIFRALQDRKKAMLSLLLKVKAIDDPQMEELNLNVFFRDFRIRNMSQGDHEVMQWHALLRYDPITVLEVEEVLESLRNVMSKWADTACLLVERGLFLTDKNSERHDFLAGFEEVCHVPEFGRSKRIDRIMFDWVANAPGLEAHTVLGVSRSDMLPEFVFDKAWRRGVCADPARLDAVLGYLEKKKEWSTMARFIQDPGTLIGFIRKQGAFPLSVFDWASQLENPDPAHLHHLVEESRKAGVDIFSGSMAWAEKALSSLEDRESCGQKQQMLAEMEVVENIWTGPVGGHHKASSPVNRFMKKWDEDYARLSVLLSLCGRLDERDEQGWTLLHHAVFRGQMPAVRMLIESGASTTVKNTDGLDAEAMLAFVRMIHHTPLAELGTLAQIEALMPVIERTHLDESLGVAAAVPGKGPRRL